MPLILASASPYRKLLLERFSIPFEVVVSGIDEAQRKGETPEDLVRRLAAEKASAVAALRPEAAVIGSDQIALLDGQVFGKPGTRERAVQQLSKASGRMVRFLTAVALRTPDSREAIVALVPTDVHFRSLTRDEIERYLDREPALNCAGSFQIEGLGITLTERIESPDPTALIGLPLITLSRMLVAAGFLLP